MHVSIQDGVICSAILQETVSGANATHQLEGTDLPNSVFLLLPGPFRLHAQHCLRARFLLV